MQGSLNPDQGLALFTDGSCWIGDQIGGWGFILIDAYEGEENAFGHEFDTTNNRMEMTAAIKGLEYVAKEYGWQDLLVYSDSEYLVLGVNVTGRKRKVNKDLWERLDYVRALHTTVEFFHVKGHDVSHYNHLADHFASIGRQGGIKMMDTEYTFKDDV